MGSKDSKHFFRVSIGLLRQGAWELGLIKSETKSYINQIWAGILSNVKLNMKLKLSLAWLYKF